MDISNGLIVQLWSLLCFLPVFVSLVLLGTLKAAIIGPVAAIVITVGNSGVILGLWPAHAIWTYYCLARAKKYGPVLKVVLLIGLVVPIILCPIVVILGSFLAGLGYGFVTPLVATFEAVGKERENKYVHCFVDGTWSVIKRSFTVVRDFTDVCFHSYFSYMDDFHDQQPKDGKPLDIRLLQLPGCLLVGLLGVIVDVPIITLLAIWKSPYMLLKGWHQLLHDLIGREGPFLETVCVPFAGLVIFVWPLVVILAILTAFMSSFLLGLYGAVVVYQETSLQLGLAYIVSAIALFDEYSNDLLYMRAARPNYRNEKKSCSGGLETCYSLEKQRTNGDNRASLPIHGKSIPERSASLKGVLQDMKSVQIWDRLFQSCELYGRVLVQDGVIRFSDLEEWSRTGKSRILSSGLPAYCILQSLLHSAKFDSASFPLFDGTELTKSDRPEDRVFEWFFEPLMIMKEQIRAYEIHESEALYLRKLALMSHNPERMEAWQNGGVPPENELKRAELEALSRRLQGMATSLSRMPTFRRRFQNVVKILLQVALETQSSKLSNSRLPTDSNESERNMKAKNKLDRLFQQEGSKKHALLNIKQQEANENNDEGSKKHVSLNIKQQEANENNDEASKKHASLNIKQQEANENNDEGSKRHASLNIKQQEANENNDDNV